MRATQYAGSVSLHLVIVIDKNFILKFKSRKGRR
jgi:hypothetical protein